MDMFAELASLSEITSAPVRVCARRQSVWLLRCWGVWVCALQLDPSLAHADHLFSSQKRRSVSPTPTHLQSAVQLRATPEASVEDNPGLDSPPLLNNQRTGSGFN